MISAYVCASKVPIVNFTEKKCHVVVKESNGIDYTYDLSPIGSCYLDYDGKKYTINMCDGVPTCSSDAAVCMEDDDAATHADDTATLGRLTKKSALSLGGDDPGQGCVILYGDGDECPGSHYTSTILVLCDPQQHTPLVTVLPDDCDYSFQVITKYGCGSIATSSEEQELDSGSSEDDVGEIIALVILILLFVSVILYFALGAIYQKKRHDASTFREYVIHSEFWCSLPGLVVDGVKFIFRGCKKADYTPV